MPEDATAAAASVSPSAVNTSVWTMHTRTTLHSVDAAGNRFRFFIVELWAPPVGSGAALRKRWGRIGTEGQSDTLYFDGVDGAKHYAEVLLRRRRKRGYVEVGGDGSDERWKLLELEAGLELRLRAIRRRLRRAREQLRAGVDAPGARRRQLVLWT